MLEWFSQIVGKLASEIHKSKLDELEKRIIVLEERLKYRETEIEKVTNKNYELEKEVTKLEAVIQTVILLQKK